MAHDQARIREFARSYTDAWCSHDPKRGADHFVSGGTIAINGGEPTEVTEVARSFIEAFPDIQVFMDDVVFNDETVAYHRTFRGTNTGRAVPDGPCGSPASRSGRSETTASSPASRGGYDQDEYDRQSPARLARAQPLSSLGAPSSSDIPAHSCTVETF